MAARRTSLTGGGWRAFALSVLVHAAIVAAALFGWFTWKRESPPVETLAVEATVVDARDLKGVDKLPPAPEPVPEPQPPPPPEPQPDQMPAEDQGPPKPDPAEIERKQEEERLAAEQAEREKKEQEQKQKDAEELKEREDAAKLEAQKRAAAEKAAAEKTAAEKAAADKRAADKKRADDAAAAKQAADEKARLAREAELRRSLEAEERGNALRNSDEANRWHAQIIARIQRAWIRPPSAAAGIECIVAVSQVQGGEVTSVQVQSCNGGGDAMRQSVQDAVYRASPLPAPPDPSLFERNLLLTFRPT